MLEKVRQRIVRLFLAAAVTLMLLGAPTVVPVHAGECPVNSGSGSC